MTNGRHPRSWLLIGLISFAIFLATGCPLPIYLPTSARESVPDITLDAIPDSIHAGETATLKWDVKSATHVEITPLGDVPSSGSRIVSPLTTTTYVLTASGSGGTSKEEKKVTVTPVPVSVGSP
jgi:hypothetical protein